MTENPNENQYLDLIPVVPLSKLLSWLNEFYGKDVTIEKLDVLRHRDFSYVARITINDALPETIIFKLVLPPWHVEQDIIERILIPSIAYSPQIYLSGQYQNMTAMLIEDLGPDNIVHLANHQIASLIGENLAKFHRSYCYRVDEIAQLKILNMLTAIECPDFCRRIFMSIEGYKLDIDPSVLNSLKDFSSHIAIVFANEPITLVHGDFFAENIIYNHAKLHFIDWSWFTLLSFPLLDLGTITSQAPKNGVLANFKDQILESYSFESGKDLSEINRLLPYANVFTKILFLNWLVLRKSMGIEGTTVGPVNALIKDTVDEIQAKVLEING